MNYILYACIGALFYAFFNVVARHILIKTKYVGAYTVLWQAAAGILVLLFLPLDSVVITLTGEMLLMLLYAVCIWAMSDAFLFAAFKHEEASILANIFPISNIIVFVISIYFFNVQPTVTIVGGFMLILFSAYLITMQTLKVKLSKGVFYGLYGAILTGLGLIINALIVHSFSVVVYTSISFVFPALINYFIFLRPTREQIKQTARDQWRMIIVSAFIIDGAIYATTKAYQTGNIAHVAAISASTTLLTALFSIVFLRERTHIPLKIIATLLTTIGIILIQR